MKKKENAACPVRKTSIGGQALIEGIMMRGPKKTAMAVRNPEGEVILEKWDNDISKRPKIFKLPVFRGVYGFVDSMKTGFKCLMRSAEIAGLEDLDNPKKPEESPAAMATETAEIRTETIAASQEGIQPETVITAEEPVAKIDTSPAKAAEATKAEDKKKGTGALMVIIMIIATVLGVSLAIFLFIMLPTLLFSGLDTLTKGAIQPDNEFVSSLIKSAFEGILKLVILVLYMVLVSRMKDIKRTFMYHGAEHKTIFCYEANKELTVENIRSERRFHPRCGTSFIVLMLLVGIFVSFFIDPVVRLITGDAAPVILRTAIKFLTLPIIMGLGYELLKFAGKHENAFTKIISAPGMWLQRITVLEPTDDMIECSIKAFVEVIPENNGDK